MARVIKLGTLSTDDIVEAIRNPTPIKVHGVDYTFTDCRVFGRDASLAGVFAQLSKYKPHGSVDVVRDDLHAVEQEEVKNLIEASSPFVYLPEYSGIAYRHVWNVFSREQFEKAFCELVETSKAKFFVRCQLRPITDLRTFVNRLAKLDKVIVLQAAVKPPNPLFGPCWKSLGDYLKKRNLEEIQIKEQAEVGIKTNIAKIAEAVSDMTKESPGPQDMMEPLLDGVGDAALLMAADGYGKAKVVGVEGDKTVTIRTSENQKSFLLKADASPDELLHAASEEFSKINVERNLEHP